MVLKSDAAVGCWENAEETREERGHGYLSPQTRTVIGLKPTEENNMCTR